MEYKQTNQRQILNAHATTSGDAIIITMMINGEEKKCTVAPIHVCSLTTGIRKRKLHAGSIKTSTGNNYIIHWYKGEKDEGSEILTASKMAELLKNCLVTVSIRSSHIILTTKEALPLDN